MAFKTSRGNTFSLVQVKLAHLSKDKDEEGVPVPSFLISQKKHCVVGAHWNRLYEMIPMSTHDK